jgi:hypothetical protein
MAQVIVAKLNKLGKPEKVYDSISVAAKTEGLDASNIRKVANGERNHVGGIKFTKVAPKTASILTEKYGTHFGTMSAKKAAL